MTSPSMRGFPNASNASKLQESERELKGLWFTNTRILCLDGFLGTLEQRSRRHQGKIVDNFYTPNFYLFQQEQMSFSQWVSLLLDYYPHERIIFTDYIRPNKRGTFRVPGRRRPRSI